jgi:hypothetical protein
MNQVFKVLAQVGRVVTGRQMAGRGVTVYPDDVFLVSYPRSGNTWARFLISNLIHPEEPTTFSNVESRIPEIYFNPDHVMRRLPRPRILKSHECFQPHYPRLIYVARDPRDVAISFYHHNVKWRNIPDNYPMEEFVPRFMAAEFDTRWGSWSDHIMSWLSMRQGRKEFLFLRYEDMKKDPAGALRQIAAFLRESSFSNLDIDEQRLARAVELSSPERMRKLEKEEAGKWVLTKQTRSDKPFVRTANAGGWKSVLSKKSVAQIESGWGEIMRNLGYDLSIESSMVAKS